MAVTNPKRTDLTAYAGNTFDFLYTFDDQNGNAIDLSADYNDIEFRIFKSGSKASPEVDLTVSGGGLMITNTNELSGTVTASDTDSMPSVVWYEIEFTLSDGSSEVYLFGRFFVNNFTDDGEKTAEFTITINQNTNDVSFSESYDAAAKATQAKVDTQNLKDSLEWKGAWDTSTTYTEDNRVSYQGESFISLQDGNQGNTPVGDSNDSFWDILVEQNSAVSTLDDTNTTDPVSGKATGDYVKEGKKVFYEKSPVGAMINVDSIIAWDNKFYDTSKTTADSGQSYTQQTIGLPNFVSREIYSIPITASSNAIFEIISNISVSNDVGNKGAIILGVDNDNWYAVRIADNQYIAQESVGGTVTDLDTISPAISDVDISLNQYKIIINYRNSAIHLVDERSSETHALTFTSITESSLSWIGLTVSTFGSSQLQSVNSYLVRNTTNLTSP